MQFEHGWGSRYALSGTMLLQVLDHLCNLIIA
jgi:hypothetical protein